MKKSIALTAILAALLFLFTACAAPAENPLPDETVENPTAGEAEPPASSESEEAPETPAPSPEEAGPSEEPSEDAVTPITDNLAGKPLNQFEADVTLDVQEHRLLIEQTLTYQNSTGSELQDLYFNLIPNAFSGDGGGVEVTSLTAGGAEASLEQVDGTVYRMALADPLPDGAALSLEMEYTVRIPNIQNRFGYQDTTYNVGNFLITPAVFESGGWVVEPYVDLGDAFYSDLADYTIRIHVPEGYTVAAAGTLGEDGAYHAAAVRDYVFCAAADFETMTAEENGTTILVYYRDEMDLTAARVLETSQKSLSLFNRLFGAYPYDTLTVVLSGLTGGVSGTEYPTLVMVGPEIPLEMLQDGSEKGEENGYRLLIDRTVAHEIAHQWFYGIVGNDQIRYPFLDEGLCRFAEYLYEDAYPPEQPQPDFSYAMADFLADSGIQESGDPTLRRTLYDWVDEGPEDYSFVYIYGGAMFYEMEETMGKDAFRAALRDYVDEFAYGFVTPEEFQAFWNARADFSGLFARYWNG